VSRTFEVQHKSPDAPGGVRALRGNRSRQRPLGGDAQFLVLELVT
jgi:hypothetical protein